jgi:hypothetical protein
MILHKGFKIKLYGTKMRALILCMVHQGEK